MAISVSCDFDWGSLRRGITLDADWFYNKAFEMVNKAAGTPEEEYKDPFYFKMKSYAKRQLYVIDNNSDVVGYHDAIELLSAQLQYDFEDFEKLTHRY